MKRKTYIISLVLLITILLIGVLKYLIKNDTIQTQADRLHFYSENLTIQKNSIINSFENYSNLISDDIYNNTKLINYLSLLNKEQFPLDTDQVIPVYQFSNTHLHHLQKLGFSFLSFSLLKNNQLYRISVANQSLDVEPNQYAFSPYKKVNNTLESSFFFNDKKLRYKFSYPLQSSQINPTIYLETGFEFSLLRELVKKNIPKSLIGFLFIGDNSIISKSAATDFEFEQPNNNFNLFFDKQLSNNIGSFLTTEFLRKLSNLLLSGEGTISNNSLSLYLTFKNEPKAISLTPLTFNEEKNMIFLVSVINDSILDKTNEWNNEIFLINLIIIILIMIGITYLIINRISLMKEKEAIFNSELKLKEMNESKDKFFSIIAHDLKNPFNGIMGMTGYLSENYDETNDNERKEIISDLNISSKNAFNLLQNLLEWTRTQSGTIKNVPVIIEPVNIIEISLETVINLAKSKEIEIKLSKETDKFGYADENLVTTVLRNLFTNAVKFSERNSTIEVIVKDYENELVFCVKDSGIGLKPDEIDQLFRIDRNFHKKGTEKETGTGLGLKICKEFIEYCHGRIWVVSEFQKGSSFFFTVPIYSE